MTGKTTYLSKQIEAAAEKYSPDLVMVASFTKAATAELNRRQLPIPESNIGTLHSFCYRSLDNPTICETGKGLKEFSEANPRYALSGGSREAVDDGHVSSGEGKGDAALMAYSRLRALMRPRELWPSALKGFAKAWEGYKQETGTMDFTDLIETALRDVERPACMPVVGFLDEAQDLSRLEAALWRKWSETMKQTIIVLDPAQCLYRFKGSDPEAIYDPAKVFTTLKQSYRLPGAVKSAAERLLARSGLCREYQARGADGAIKKAPFTYHDANQIIDTAMPYVEKYQSVLVLTSCGYMLSPLLEALRSQGIPYANPFRRKRRDWNPLHRRKNENSAAERVAAFMAAFNREPAQWLLEEVTKWIGLTKGVARRGWQEYAKCLPTEKLLSSHDLLGIMSAEDLESAMSGTLFWLETKLSSQWAKTAGYALRVAAREPLGLIEEPLFMVGTIHCSPPDEPILTTKGWVKMMDLDPEEHRIPTYYRKNNTLKWGWKKNKEMGYKFEISKREYSGSMVTFCTLHSLTRVTPNHVVMARFNDEFSEKYVVYLMRRNDWWRVGICVSAHKPYRSGGVGGRLATEQADVGWILGVYKSRRAALIAEEIIRGKYGITGLTFQSAKSRALTDKDLHYIHDQINESTNKRVSTLLNDFGLSIDWPLYSRSPLNGEVIKRNMRGNFATESANLVALNGYVNVLVTPRGFLDVGTYKIWGTKGNRARGTWSPIYLNAEVSSEQYDGYVYGIEVPPHHYYISGGMVVHNSVKGGEADVVILFPDISPQGYQELSTREGKNSLVRTFYVGMTRARDTLIWGGPSGRMAFPWRECG